MRGHFNVSLDAALSEQMLRRHLLRWRHYAEEVHNIKIDFLSAFDFKSYCNWAYNKSPVVGPVTHLTWAV